MFNMLKVIMWIVVGICAKL